MKSETKIKKKPGRPKKCDCQLLKGIVRLIEGQLRFADEFGLNRSRIFPGISEQLQTRDIENVLRNLLNAGAEGQEQLEKLFNALTDHQLVLMTALDSVALQTVKVLETKGNKNLRERLRTVLKRNLPSNWSDLKHNQQARYRELVVPGFLDAYVRICGKE